MGLFGVCTTHGFRSSFMDWSAENTDYPKEVRDLCLAHKVSDQVEAAYRRGTLFAKRVELMQLWGSYCTRYSDNVVSIAA